jgi:hypothetical protein
MDTVVNPPQPGEPSYETWKAEVDTTIASLKRSGIQCCGSGMFIPDPGCLSRIPDPGSWIPDPKTGTICHTFFCSHKFHKIVNYFIFEMLKKKIWANFQRIIELFTQKIVTLSKIWV